MPVHGTGFIAVQASAVARERNEISQGTLPRGRGSAEPPEMRRIEQNVTAPRRSDGEFGSDFAICSCIENKGLVQRSQGSKIRRLPNRDREGAATKPVW